MMDSELWFMVIMLVIMTLLELAYVILNEDEKEGEE